MRELIEDTAGYRSLYIELAVTVAPLSETVDASTPAPMLPEGDTFPPSIVTLCCTIAEDDDKVVDVPLPSVAVVAVVVVVLRTEPADVKVEDTKEAEGWADEDNFKGV